VEIKRQSDIIHKVPSDDPSYPYSKSAQVFHTNQLFLYSEKVGPGKKTSAPHFHRSIDEIIYITSGELCVIEGEEETVLKKGDSILFKANSQKKHYLENRSSISAEFLIFRRSTKTNDVVY